MKFWPLLFLLLAWPLTAQVLDGAGAPPAPTGRILDEARLFKLKPELRGRLSDRLKGISERTGYEIYVAIFDSLISSDVSEQSRLLQDAWIGSRPGVVLVMESDSSVYELGWSLPEDVVSEMGDRVPVLVESDLAPQEKVMILKVLSGLKPVEDDSTESAAQLIDAFAKGIDDAFKQVEAAGPELWNVRVLMLGTGMLAGMLLIGLLIGAWIRRSDRKVSERRVFPEVTVGMRLGAQFGGGKVSSRSFDVLPHEKA